MHIKEENKISENTAIITITKTIVGTTLLTMPYLLKTQGILLGGIFLFANAIIGIIVVDILLKCKDITRKL